MVNIRLVSKKNLSRNEKGKLVIVASFGIFVYARGNSCDLLLAKIN